MARAKGATRKSRKPWTGTVVAEVATQYGIQTSSAEREAVLSPREVGLILGVSGEAVTQWIYRRRLPAAKLGGGRWKIRKSDLEAFLRNRNSAARPKVLTVGLDQADLQAMRASAQAAGLDILTAQSSLDALLKLREYQPALLVMDCSSAEYGFAFLEKLVPVRRRYRVPIMLAAPATFDEKQLDRAMSLGVQACLTKPLSAERLKGEIERLIKQYI